MQEIVLNRWGEWKGNAGVSVNPVTSRLRCPVRVPLGSPTRANLGTGRNVLRSKGEGQATTYKFRLSSLV